MSLWVENKSNSLNQLDSCSCQTVLIETQIPVDVIKILSEHFIITILARVLQKLSNKLPLSVLKLKLQA